jgi:hypothetical protein
MSAELEKYYLNLDKTPEVNEQIKNMIDEFLQKDNHGPPSERNYILLIRLIYFKNRIYLK